MTCTSRTQTNTPRLFGEARAIIHCAYLVVGKHRSADEIVTPRLFIRVNKWLLEI